MSHFCSGNTRMLYTAWLWDIVGRVDSVLLLLYMLYTASARSTLTKQTRLPNDNICVTKQQTS